MRREEKVTHQSNIAALARCLDNSRHGVTTLSHEPKSRHEYIADLALNNSVSRVNGYFV